MKKTRIKKKKLKMEIQYIINDLGLLLEQPQKIVRQNYVIEYMLVL